MTTIVIPIRPQTPDDVGNAVYSGTHSTFREKIKKNFRRCLITRYDEKVCDAAHIIPVKICQEFQLPYIYHHANGLFLCKNLHVCYDLNLWTFDIFDFQWSPEQPHIYFLPIITNQPRRKIPINQYQHDVGDNLRRYPIHKEHLPYLFIHYQVYLESNYSTKKKLDIYRECLQDPRFAALLRDPDVLQRWRADFSSIRLAVSHQPYLDNYLVVYDNHPWSENQWLPDYHVPGHLRRQYLDWQQYQNDPDY